VQLGLNFTEEEMKEMIAEANPSDSGQVNFKGKIFSV
jgi:Ca2+-binding EF-hand superfamily protein